MIDVQDSGEPGIQLCSVSTTQSSFSKYIISRIFVLFMQDKKLDWKQFEEALARGSSVDELLGLTDPAQQRNGNHILQCTFI